MGKTLGELLNKYENQGTKAGWFSLKDDGDSATVRMLHKGQIGTEPDGSPKYDLDVLEVHKMDVDGSGRDGLKITLLRSLSRWLLIFSQLGRALSQPLQRRES